MRNIPYITVLHLLVYLWNFFWYCKRLFILKISRVNRGTTWNKETRIEGSLFRHARTRREVEAKTISASARMEICLTFETRSCENWSFSFYKWTENIYSSYIIDSVYINFIISRILEVSDSSVNDNAFSSFFYLVFIENKSHELA